MTAELTSLPERLRACAVEYNMESPYRTTEVVTLLRETADEVAALLNLVEAAREVDDLIPTLTPFIEDGELYDTALKLHEALEALGGER